MSNFLWRRQHQEFLLHVGNIFLRDVPAHIVHCPAFAWIFYSIEAYQARIHLDDWLHRSQAELTGSWSFVPLASYPTPGSFDISLNLSSMHDALNFSLILATLETWNKQRQIITYYRWARLGYCILMRSAAATAWGISHKHGRISKGALKGSSDTNPHKISPPVSTPVVVYQPLLTLLVFLSETQSTP